LNSAGGNDTSRMVVELATLFVEPNSPGTSGTLFTVDVNNENSLDCNMSIQVDTTRGEIVKKDSTAASVTLPQDAPLPPGYIKIPWHCCDCTVPNVVNLHPADANVLIISAGNVVGVRDYNWSPIIAKGRVMAQNPAAGTTLACGSAVNYTISVGQPTQTCFDPCGAGYTSQRTAYNGYITNKWDPNCWCEYPIGSGFQCHGDADGKKTAPPNNYRIYTGDLILVTSNWGKKAGVFPLGANPCADIDHKATAAPNSYKVYTGDLARVTSNWMAQDCTSTSDTNPKHLPRNCPLSDATNNGAYTRNCASGK